MPPSASIWAAALVLATFSGSASLHSMAEAAPAPQQNQAHPVYYVPRHAKRAVNLIASSVPSVALPSPRERNETLADTRGEPQQPTEPNTHKESNLPDAGSVKSRQELSNVANTRPNIGPDTTPSKQPTISPTPEPAPEGIDRPTPTGNPKNTSPSSRPSTDPDEQLPKNLVGDLTPAVGNPIAQPSSTAGNIKPDLPVTTPTGGILDVITPRPSPTPVQEPEIIKPSSTPTKPAQTPGSNNLFDPIIAPANGIVSPVLSVVSTVIPPLLGAITSGVVSNLDARPTSLLSDDLVPSPVIPTPPVLPTGPVLSSPLPEITPTRVPILPSDRLSPPAIRPTGLSPLGALPTGFLNDPEVGLPSVLPTGILPSITPNGVFPSITPNGVLPSVTPTGVLPSVFPTGFVSPSVLPDLPRPSGILVGLTSALGGVIPTSLPDFPSKASTVAGVLPSSPAILSVDLSIPTPTGFIQFPPSMVTNPPGSGLVGATGVHPTATNLPALLSSALSEVPGINSGAPFNVPSSSVVLPTGIIPTGTAPISIPPKLPTPTGNGTPFGVPSGVLTSAPVHPTLSQPTNIPVTEALATPTSGPTPQSTTSPILGSIPIPTIPSITTKPTPVLSLMPIGTNSATAFDVGSSIIREPSTMPSPSATVSGIPPSLPKMIAPPGGVPQNLPQDSFMGQVCFKWPLNYPFVSANDGGNQIFHYLPMAIADGLNISTSDVKNLGLKPLDTTAYQGFITTLAMFTIPKDLQITMQSALRNPADSFWHNTNTAVNDLTDLINTACPLPAGKLPGDGSTPNQVVDPTDSSPAGQGDGSAIGGDIGANRKVNSTSAIAASGAVVGAMAYGAAMFFIARRYRNKRIALHQRASSFPSTRRMTYDTISGGTAAWMHGARNGRITPGSRNSLGSDDSQDGSIRTAQISAPFMAENSLGWN